MKTALTSILPNHRKRHRSLKGACLMKKVAVLAFILCLVSMIVSGSSAEPLLEDGESRFLHAQILADDQLWMIDEYSQTILRMDISLFRTQPRHSGTISSL